MGKHSRGSTNLHIALNLVKRWVRPLEIPLGLGATETLLRMVLPTTLYLASHPQIRVGDVQSRLSKGWSRQPF